MELQQNAKLVLVSLRRKSDHLDKRYDYTVTNISINNTYNNLYHGRIGGENERSWLNERCRMSFKYLQSWAWECKFFYEYQTNDIECSCHSSPHKCNFIAIPTSHQNIWRNGKCQNGKLPEHLIDCLIVSI